MTLYGYSVSDLTLENVQNLSIGPYSLAYEGIFQDFLKSGIDYEKENWVFKVLDFTPNLKGWRIMNAKDFPGTVLAEPNCSEDCPVDFPVHFGGPINTDIFA